MNTIKFKALFEYLKNGKRIWQESTVDHTISYPSGMVQKSVWLQYVGKNDINGVQIFESDVFKFEYLDMLGKPIQLLGSFVYGEDLGFDIEVYGVDDNQNDMYTVIRYINNGQFRKFEVIGNIKETPDLVEKYAEGE